MQAVARPTVLLAGILAFAAPAALAQQPAAGAPPAAAPMPMPRPPFTRDQYVQYVEQRAALHAGQAFDQIDADHDGTVDAEEWASWRAQRRAHAAGARRPAPPPAAAPSSAPPQ